MVVPGITGVYVVAYLPETIITDRFDVGNSKREAAGQVRQVSPKPHLDTHSLSEVFHYEFEPALCDTGGRNIYRHWVETIREIGAARHTIVVVGTYRTVAGHNVEVQ